MLDNSYNPIHSRFGHRCYTFSTDGVIQYDPPRGNKTESHWCILDVNKGITEYYRNQFKKKFGIVLFKPAFDAHVSVLKGLHTPKMDSDWGFLDGKNVEIWYDSNLYWNEQHVWLNTYSKEFFQLREYYDIPDWNTKSFGHLTIGKFQA
jgi:hypothetical protein